MWSGVCPVHDIRLVNGSGGRNPALLQAKMSDLFPIQHAYLIPLLPLLGAAVAGFFGARFLKGASHWPIWITVGTSAILSFWITAAMIGQIGEHQEGWLGVPANFYTWIQAGDFVARAGFWFDPLTAVMLCVVCGIGFLITVFSAGYMKGEEGYFRFFAYLGLFIFSMCCVIMGENLLMLYVGWEAVGLSSYLLIGYYYQKPSAREAAKKAFLVNRVGDFGFALGIMLTYLAFGTISFFGDGWGSATPGFLEMVTMTPEQLAAIPGVNLALVETAKTWVPFLLMAGAFGKSAQFPLYVWLPDAMEGPTPVSALIHAATMVTSGVYMIVRCSTLFFPNEAAMVFIAVICGFTAIFAASIAVRQFDLKKVFAYSTVSQLGYMFVGVAALAPVAGMFHLVSHAFFKALLFLSCGVVMHAMAGELDLRKMSGLKRVLPKTRITMFIGCCALAGIIPFSGFWSKDEILIGAYNRSIILGLVMTVTALFTAFYAFRLYFRVFEGPLVVPQSDAHEEVHGGYGAGADPRVAASTSAVHVGAPEESGVDEHLAGKSAHGHGHGHDDHHNHEPWLMMGPLVILSIGAALWGFINTPWAHYLGDFLGHSVSLGVGYQVAVGAYGAETLLPKMFGQHAEVSAPKDMHVYIMAASILVAFAGAFLAYAMHLQDRSRAERVADALGPITRMLEAKYWVDEIYQAVIVNNLKRAGEVFFLIDRFVIDGLVYLAGFIPQLSGFVLKLTTQRGYLQGYALSMLLGVAVILAVVFLR